MEGQLAAGRVDALSATDLAAGYGPRTIWAGATFQIPTGSFVAVVGPNGAGKSTLIRLMLGLLPARHGQVEVLGQPPRRGNPAIGYVPQGRLFDPDLALRGRDFVRLGVDGHRWGVPLPGTGRRAAATVAQSIDAVGAAGYADRPIGRLSGGEQQRLLLAQSLVGRPRILLLDEPLTNLDLSNQAAITQLVAQLARAQRLTVLLIAHDLNPLMPFIDQVMVVAHGRIAIGPPSEIVTSEALSRIYGASIEVLRDSRGRVFVVGLEEDPAHLAGHGGIG